MGLKVKAVATREIFHNDNFYIIAFNPIAPFSKELPYRLIKMFSYKNDIILDPFMGSGTTAKVSQMLGRRWIGTELSKEYCDITVNRLKDV